MGLGTFNFVRPQRGLCFMLSNTGCGKGSMVTGTADCAPGRIRMSALPVKNFHHKPAPYTTADATNGNETTSG